MDIGVTGTSAGLTGDQVRSLRIVLCDLSRGHEVVVLHHGDCVGADAIAGKEAKAMGWVVHLHPPDNPKHRAFAPHDSAERVKPYLVRNHNIVDACSVLVGLPRSRKEVLRSGTWATIRYAHKVGVPVVLIYPDGIVER